MITLKLSALLNIIISPPNNNFVLRCTNNKTYIKHHQLIVGSSSADYVQDLAGEKRNKIKSKKVEQGHHYFKEFISTFLNGCNNVNSQWTTDCTGTKCFSGFINKKELQDKYQRLSCTSISSTKLTKYTNSYTNSTLWLSRSQSSICSVIDNFNMNVFGRKETEVYMTLLNDLVHVRASGTQATAFINKCLQVNSEIVSQWNASCVDTNSNYDSTCTLSTLPSTRCRKRTMDKTRYHDIYFFGRKKETSRSTGMGTNESKSKLHRTEKSSSTTIKTSKGGSNLKKGSSTQGAQGSCYSNSSQTKNARGASAGTSTMKAVSIKEDKPKKPCPAVGSTKGDMMATVSHIRIGPKEPCPVHGKEPCQGPKCIVASSGEEQPPVKVSTVTNPRRGVFELVIRKMTGAPLAKNELMLEWTPPPSRPAPCGGPCPIPCSIPTPCRPSKCKLIVCRPSPCSPKSSKRPCRSPCRFPCKSLSKCKLIICRPSPCSPKSCKRPCRSPCRFPCSKCCNIPPCEKKCMGCGLSPCTIPCAQPCCSSPCSYPCKSSPCLRPCPVGRRRPRKSRSQPKIKMVNRKRTSPCLNRSKTCPVVRCRSLPSPCIGYCGLLPCPPRKCCSVAPCKPPKCKSICSVCCI